MTDDRTERQWHETVLHLNAILDRLGPRAGQIHLGEREVAALRELRTRIHRGYHLPETTPDDLNDDVDRMVEYLRLLERSSLGTPGAHAIRRRSSSKAVADILTRSAGGDSSAPSSQLETSRSREAGTQPAQPAPGSPEYANLSPAERQILARRAEGKTDDQIADELHIAVKVVKNYIRLIEGKLGIRSAESADLTNRLPRF